MIKEKSIKLNLNAKTIQHYWILGYSGTTNEEIIVKVDDLTKGSHIKITAIYDICGTENKIPYKSYLNNLKKYNYYSCHKCCLNKKEKTWLKNIGVSHPAKSKEIRKKTEKTNIKKCGSRWYILTDEFLNNDEIKKKKRNTRIRNGYDIPDSKLTDWEIYKKKVRYETNKNKNELSENWDGYDYYDGDYIKDNYIKYKPRNPEYPSIDHKISIKYGFDNNITPKTISKIENLCITKTKINCSKRAKNETK